MILLLLITQAFAQDQWLCTSQASQLRGNQVLSCGVGIGKDENEARSRAFDHAQAEFNRLCSASTTCGHQAYLIDPKRTTCGSNSYGWKCYRLLAYTLDKTVQAKPFVYKRQPASTQDFRKQADRDQAEALALQFHDILVNQKRISKENAKQ